jgi:hypothetical protein
VVALSAVVIGAVMTLIGWVVTHRLSLNAQRQQFLDRILYEAAQQLDRAIREHSQWLGRASMDLFGFKWIEPLHNETSPEKWRAAAEKIRHHIFGGHLEWIHTLEAYEILFPETTECRVELARLEQSLVQRAQHIAIAFLHDDQRLAAFQAAELLSEQFGHQQALFEDLRRHIQNKALGTITGYKIPDRVPLDPALPILTLGPDSKLHVTEAGLPLRPET